MSLWYWSMIVVNESIGQSRGVAHSLTGEMMTWWLTSTTAKIPCRRDYSQQLNVITDTLLLPGEKRLSTVSDLDLLKTPQPSRSRSNSVRSQNSSSKSAQVFQRAGSFRHKIKSDSLSSTHVSEDNIAKMSGGGIPNFIISDDQSSRLLGRERMASPRPSNYNGNIVIQVDEVM